MNSRYALTRLPLGVVLILIGLAALNAMRGLDLQYVGKFFLLWNVAPLTIVGGLCVLFGRPRLPILVGFFIALVCFMGLFVWAFHETPAG